MIIWREECVLPKKEINSIKAHYKQDKFIVDNSYYSSYFDWKNENNYDNKFLIEFYSSKIEFAMNKFGLYHRSKYIWEMWIQIYNKNLGTHCEHDHFSGNGFISWVNFVDVPQQNCFYFIDSQKNKQYPDQKCGELIFFPSWISHGVDKLESDTDRLVVAGNIYLNQIFSNQKLFTYDLIDEQKLTWSWKLKE